MTDEDIKTRLNYFGGVLLGYGYINDYHFGVTENNRHKIEFILNNHDIIVAYIPTKGFQCYCDYIDIGIFSNWEKFYNYMKENY